MLNKIVLILYFIRLPDRKILHNKELYFINAPEVTCI